MNKLAIHLVSWNGEKYIDRLFQSLVDQTYRDVSLFVWDNASTDSTVEKMNTYKDQLQMEIVVYSENINFAAGHNKLFASTESEYVLVLNQDTYLEKDCIEKIVTYLDEHDRVGAMSPRTMQWESDIIDSLGMKVFRNRRVIERGQGEPWSMYTDRFKNTALPVFGISGAVAVYRRKALEDVAFAPDEFFDRLYTFYKEDVDLAYRLQSAGWDAVILLDAVAYHDRTTGGGRKMDDRTAARGKARQSAAARYHSYKNHIITLYKNLYWQNYLRDAIWLEWYELKKFVWVCLFDWKTARAWFEIIKKRKEILRKRRFIISKRKRSWKEMRKQLYL